MGQALDPEALVVREVQVQDVELHDGHRVEVAQDDLDRLPVARHVDHEPTPREPRLVLDRDGWKEPPVLVAAEELKEGL